MKVFTIMVPGTDALVISEALQGVNWQEDFLCPLSG
jgi:hypothetical protein